MPTNEENPPKNKTLNYNRRRVVPTLPITAARILARVSLSLSVTSYALGALLIALFRLHPAILYKKAGLYTAIIVAIFAAIYLLPLASIVAACIALKKSNRIEQPYIAELAKPALFFSFLFLTLLLCPTLITLILYVGFPHQH